MLLAGLCALVLWTSVPPAAAESCAEGPCAVPRCNEPEVYARPGVNRAFAMACFYTDRFELVRGPEHGELTELRPRDDWYLGVEWRYEPNDDGSLADGFTIRLHGPGGAREHRVAIRIKPRSQNSPPQCYPVTASQRTDGLAPVTLDMHVDCWDPDYDEVTIEGGGPGTHLDSPKAMPGGTSGREVPWWRYRTATSSGDEQSTYWATDVLGARSADAAISVRVGPGVDRKPVCGWHSADFTGERLETIVSRRDRIRRFGFVCSDPDGDVFVPRLQTPASHGAVTLVPGAGAQRWDGFEMFVGGLYVPAEGSDRDEFRVVAGGLRGDGPVTRMAIVSAPETSNVGNGGCGWSGGNTPGLPVTLTMWCDDHEGDPLSATVVGGAEHGTAGRPVVTPGANGDDVISVVYTPDPGFVGLDCVQLLISDGRGFDRTLEIDVYVTAPVPVPLVLPPVPEVPPVPPLPEPPPVPPLPEPPPVPPLPEERLPPTDPPDAAADSVRVGEDRLTWVAGSSIPTVASSAAQVPARSLAAAPGPPQPTVTHEPSHGQPPPVVPAAQARAALGTRAVRLVRRFGVAQVWATAGRDRLAITCSVACSVRARPLLTAIASRVRRATARPGSATTVRLPRRTKRVRLAVDALGKTAKATVRL